MKREFGATVTADGMLRPWDPVAWRTGLAAFVGKPLVVTVETVATKRTPAQNARYWTVLVPLAGAVLSAGRQVPLSRDEVHYVLKWAFLGRQDTPLGPVPLRSRDLNTADFSAFTDRVEAWLWHDHQVVVPAKGEGLEVQV